MSEREQNTGTQGESERAREGKRGRERERERERERRREVEFNKLDRRLAGSLATETTSMDWPGVRSRAKGLSLL